MGLLFWQDGGRIFHCFETVCHNKSMMPMMSKWRCPQWIVLALVALLACASPSLLWACSSDQCVEELSSSAAHGEVAKLSTSPCPDADCLDPHSRCCQPLPVAPNSSNAPAPPVKSVNSFGASASLPTEDSAASIVAALPRVVSVWEPVVGRVAIVSVSLFTPSRNPESPPLPGRSPPLF